MTLSELLMSGPGHDGYVYQVDVYCVECGQDILRTLHAAGKIPADDDLQRDTDHVPQPIFFGESDSAQHCADCGGYLYGPQDEDDSEPDAAPELNPDAPTDDAPHTPTGLDTFLAAYLECALWSSTDDDGHTLDDDFSPADLAPAALASAREDCADFLTNHAQDISEHLERAGHDFWLTRNRHGAGFWDGDWPHDAGRRLTDAAHVYGSSDLYISDDGLLYLS